MGSIGNSKPAARGFVLHKSDINAIPLENFSNNSKRATGGWKQICSSPDTPTDGLNLGIAHFPPRTATQESFEALHRHKQAEFYYILSGQALVKIDGVEHNVKAGAALYIPVMASMGSGTPAIQKSWSSYGASRAMVSATSCTGSLVTRKRISGAGARMQHEKSMDETSDHTLLQTRL